LHPEKLPPFGPQNPVLRAAIVDGIRRGERCEEYPTYATERRIGQADKGEGKNQKGSLEIPYCQYGNAKHWPEHTYPDKRPVHMRPFLPWT
jgi:hypothetical protein